MRVKLIELPYALPRSLYDALAAEVIRTMNILPNTKSFPLAPREMVRGDRVNVLTDISPPFGSAVLSPVASASHSTEQKQEVGIAVGVSDSTKAGVRVYLLNERNPVVRRGLKPMAMTQQIIDHMDEFAAKTKKISKTFTAGDVDKDDEPFYYVDTMAEEVIVRSEDFYREQHVQTPQGLSDTLVKISYDPTVSIPREEPPESKGTIDVIEPVSDPTDSSIYEPREKTSAILSRSPVSTPVKVASKSRSLDVSSENILESRRERKPSSKVAEKSGSKVNSVMGAVIFKVYQMSLAKALSSEVGDAAKQAAKRELKQLVDLKTWVYLRRVSDASPSVHQRETSCSMFLKPKYLANGDFSLWKARLVDGGHLTDPERYDPFEKTSPTIQLELVYVLLNLAVSEKFEVESMDVPGAYLNAQLKTGRFHKMRIGRRIAKLLLEVDPRAAEFEQQDGSILVEIRKSLYGLPEAAQLWYEYLSGALRQGGYVMCPLDPCLFIRKRNGDNRREISLIAIYVDDCLHVYRGANVRNELYSSLRNARLENLKVDQLTPRTPISFLGLNISRHPEDVRNIVINQKGYLENLLDHYSEDVEAYRGLARTPCDEHIFKPNYNQEDSVAVPVTAYMSKLMKIRYLVRSRPDIELTCAALCTRSRSPTVGDMKCANKMLKYLRDTKDLGMLIRPTDMQVVYMADSGFAVHLNRRSHSGILVGLGCEGTFIPIHWRSLVQKLVTTSSTEAELVAIYDGLDFVIWIRRVIEWIGFKQRPTKLYQDNTSTITMVHMGRGSSGSNTKHIDIRYFFVKQFVDDQTLIIDHLAREHMLADFFASPRTGRDFRRMRDILLGITVTSDE
jgi:hypothetical protein